MVHGKPLHQATNDEQAMQVLREKIAYAKERWGCTLFCVDSTATAGRPFYPDVFKAVAQAYPDVLLIPENESTRYFAYSAPLNSYVHHKITSTPVGARLVYPKAFSVLMAPDGDRSEDHAALLSAVRHGDISFQRLVSQHRSGEAKRALRRSQSETRSRPLTTIGNGDPHIPFALASSAVPTLFSNSFDVQAFRPPLIAVWCHFRID